MTTLVRLKSDEDVIISDNMTQEAGGEQPIVLSKKALHQRDADENLFLRFLELDPPIEGTTTAGSTNTTTSTTVSQAPSGSRVSISAGKPVGRTPFTMTKKLTRTSERGFGFSIVWTHPPRVEKVEPGLSADRSGILPGDYVIFVEKHNVVTMPEADVLNLIRLQGNTLILEIFRRSGLDGDSSLGASCIDSSSITAPVTSAAAHSSAVSLLQNGKTPIAVPVDSVAINNDKPLASAAAGLRRTSVLSAANTPRPPTACSGTSSSIEEAKRRLNLPQVTFSKESIAPITDNRRRFLLQLISREQNYISALHFGLQRFVQPLLERKDLISPNDHRTLFQNIDELIRISEDILEQLCNDAQEPQLNFVSRVYLSKTTAICAAYKKYCIGIKKADCVLVNKSRQTGSAFVSFITEPQVPRKRPDLTMFIHRPLQHYREILKLMQLLATNCHVDTEEFKNFSTVINELQAAYREITVSSGLMEPLGEGRPLLTLQDLESRMVFTKCKPFTLAVPGRQWIFGGDLSCVEGRSVKPYWTLLFSDIIVFAKVSRDRVLFITEEPIPIANIVDSCFHMRKKTTEFRLTVDPNGRFAESPTGYCAPDLTRTPKKSARRKSLLLRAPSLELKAVWQNLLQRQIFLVNAALSSTPLSSPLDSPDVLNTLVPLSDIGIVSASIGSIKLPSTDSINLKEQQQNNSFSYKFKQKNRLANATNQIDMLIDEKCRILNKTGTPKSSALHLANWMKGQLDKQQEQARLTAERSRENISHEDEHLLYPESDQDERITYWTRQQLEKRTKELNLAKELGNLKAKANFGGKRLSGVEELNMSEYSEAVSQISQSHSTTSDSQITVRSSPIVLDKLTVCRHCHKNCQQSFAIQPHNGSTSNHPATLLCNSLKVQHSQASPQRCCKLNGTTPSRAGSIVSMSSSTVTGDHPSENSSKVVASSSKRETGDTESDVAQLITDELSQSEATDDSVGAITSGSSGIDEARNHITDSISKLRILHDKNEARPLKKDLVNGHWSGSSGGESDQNLRSERRIKPVPPPRDVKILSQTAKRTTKETADQQAKTTIIRTETAQIVHLQDNKPPQSSTMTKSPKSSKFSSANRSAQFVPCNCKCTSADFEHTTLSPDELEQQTCKIIDSPKQSPKMPRQSKYSNTPEDPPEHNKCVCANTSRSWEDLKTHQNDDNISLMLIGLAQFSPASTLLNIKTTPVVAPPTPTKKDANFVPAIAVVPPTPEAVLTKTSTNLWDNSGTCVTTSTATKVHINNVPHQAVVENIAEDSCDESPLDEEPPYRQMNNALRRYGTMSSLEKLPSEDLLDDTEIEDLEDDDDDDDVGENEVVVVDEDDDNDDEADEDDEVDDNARADYMENIGDIQVVTKEVYDSNETDTSTVDSGAWASRAGSYMAGKMSFFEESRAFIDKYLGRWNQEQSTQDMAVETDEQLDECTSGATSGEEVWGTPTSGGDNDDIHLVNSENTHSSSTKSSTSFNDDDDTELMMDELLMAPPMTASSIRGLLPRRRLEPLFEEETESDEEKTQQESEDVKKGETTTNGHVLEDLAGSSNDEEENEMDYLARMNSNDDLEEEEDESISMEERLQVNLQTNRLGPRPLRNPESVQIPPVVLRPSACEYLLEQSPAATLVSTTDSNYNSNSQIGEAHRKSAEKTDTSESQLMMTVQQQAAAIRVTQTLQHAIRSSISTTINNEKNTTSKSSSGAYSKCTASMKVSTEKVIPPPPPPRRLLLTKTNSGTPKNGQQAPQALEPQHKFCAFADDGCSAVVGDVDDDSNASSEFTNVKQTTMKTATPTAMIPLSIHPNQAASAGVDNVASIAKAKTAKPQSSSTIIETCLLGQVASQKSTSSTTVLTRRAIVLPPVQRQGAQPLVVKKKQSASTAGAHEDTNLVAGFRLSPRLEMRLALNHDILDDEDLICYDPGPDLTTILGHDLSTFQRLTGRDLSNRLATNRAQPKGAVISYSQQRNSKMDTPTVNRRPRPTGASIQSPSTSLISLAAGGGSARVGGAPQHPQPNRNTWSSSAYADQSSDVHENSVVGRKSNSCNRNAKKLGDLEILSKRERIYCMSQSKSGSLAKMAMETTNSKYFSVNTPHQLTRAPSITSMGAETESGSIVDETAHTDITKSLRLMNFIKRRNSERSVTPNCSQSSLNDLNSNSTPNSKQMSQMSPRKDNDRPSLNRRLWKQITKRRRANSVSDIVAS